MLTHATRLAAFVILIAAVTCSTAMSASLNDSRIGKTKMELQAQIHHSTDVIQFFTSGRGRWMPARRHRSCSAVPWRSSCGRARSALAAHRWLLRRAQTRYQAVSRPAHYAGWFCITHGAYPGAPHEGNGYNGSYTGPLGMTTPWLGFYPPGRDWVHSSRIEVYGIAERVAAAHGFNDGFMRGQWPNTYPGCAALF